MRRPPKTAGVVAAVLVLGGLGTWAMGDSEWGSDHCWNQFMPRGDPDLAEPDYPEIEVDGWSWWPPGVRCRVDGRAEVTAPW